MAGGESLLIVFDKVGWPIMNYDGTKYLVLLGSEKYNSIYDKTRYLIQVKSSFTCDFSYDYGKIKIDSHSDLTLEVSFFLYNVVTLINSVLNSQSQNHYYCS